MFRVNGHWNLSKILSHENDQKFKSNQQRMEVNIRYVPGVPHYTEDKMDELKMTIWYALSRFLYCMFSYILLSFANYWYCYRG